MSDAYRPADPDRHDTAAYVRPMPGQQPTPAAPGAGDWYVPAGAAAPNPEAAHWQARYRRQRTITAVLGVGVAVALMAVVGLGVAAWQLARSNPLMTAASDLAAGLGQDPGSLLGGGDTTPAPDQSPGDGTAPDPAVPDTAQPDIPLPEPLRDLGSALGITDVGDLIDLAVANGLMSAEDADKLRAALAAGAVVGGLGDGAQQQ